MEEHLRIEKRIANIGEKVGQYYIKHITSEKREITSHEITDIIDKVKNRICENNNIDPRTIKIHIISSNDINAFALPGGKIVINAGIIKCSRSVEEIAGVIAHEIAHIEKKHTMKILTRLVVMNAIVKMISSTIGRIRAETLKFLSTTAYSRETEEEADETAVQYLNNCKIDPAGFANLMQRLSIREPVIYQKFTFISRHPNSEQRAIKILEKRNATTIKYQSILDNPSEWSKITKTIN
jgi:predicted Zn-dependent protease